MKWVRGQSGNPTGGPGRPPLTAAAREAQRFVMDLSLPAVRRLEALVASPEPQVALAACRMVLDRAYGKPMASVVEADAAGEQAFAQLPQAERLVVLEEARARVEMMLRMETDAAVEDWERTGLHVPPLLARNGRP